MWKLIAAVALLAAVALAQPNPCSQQIVSPTGDIYNFSDAIGLMLLADTPASTYGYNMSVCSSTIKCSSCTYSTGVCELSSYPYCSGNFSYIQGVEFGEGVQLEYSGGTYSRSTRFIVQCDPNITHGFVVNDDGIVVKGYRITVTARSAFACPVGHMNATPQPVPTPSDSNNNNNNNNNKPAAPPAYENFVIGGIIAALVLLVIAVIALIVLIVKFQGRGGYEPVK